jgi:hypothetical protein
VKKCPNCQQDIPDAARLCPLCGVDTQMVASQEGASPAYGPSPTPLYGSAPPSQPSGGMEQPYQPYPPPSQPYQGYPPPNQGYPPSQAFPPPNQGYPPSQGYPPPSRPYTPPNPSNVLPSIFGETKDPTTVQPSNAVQRSFLTNFQRNATNPLVGGIIGAVAAVLACIVLTFAFLLLVGSAINSTFAGQSGSVSALIGSSLTGNLLNFVALEHHATLALSSSAAGISATVNITLPLTTLLIIPALALMLGGYIAAATDYSNQMRFVIGRAAAVGPFYGALLALIMALFGTQSASSDVLLGTSASYSFGPTWPTVLLYGVLWGILFSALGGFIKLFGSRWRAGAVSFLAQQSQAPWVAGLMGALPWAWASC